jgi:chromosome segregation ATPase
MMTDPRARPRSDSVIFRNEAEKEDSMTEEQGGLRARSEEALGELAQALLENPLLGEALGRALGAGERAAQAQRSALGALDVASAGDLERLTRRLRALSDRVEALEDAVDSLSAAVATMRRERGADGGT